MKLLKYCQILAAAISLAAPFPAVASVVSIHDPSIVVAWKDASGNSYPDNDANRSRTKTYYVFGTMKGAAYSTDMTNWTSFSLPFLLNDTVSTDDYQIFKAEGDYAGHTTTSDLSGNLWAPDVIYNTAMQKWCMYFALAGNEFKSSIILLTSDKIEGPYKKVGAVVYGGFTNAQMDIGHIDYQDVTGSATVDTMYVWPNEGTWNNNYGASVIDPCVRYDQSGKLWMSYGSWSGGVFLLKLDEKTGMRDKNWNYGYSSPAWNGTELRYDTYFGLHIAGGYYVSGEGSYIRYFQDPDGNNGYYYLFESLGGYAPDGGYTMRVFRSPSIDGYYTDITGDTATFGGWVFNYGSNTTYGFPIMQNYKWSWWSMASVAQGGNSALRDDDGSDYLIYHRKFDTGNAWHKLEVHQMFFNDLGWIMAAPFAFREGVGLRKTAYSPEKIAGVYGVISHDPVDYANLKSNQEQELYVNADGTLSGAYTGTWTYSFSSGRQFLTLATSTGTFHGVLVDQLMEGLGSSTIAFTATDPATEHALWGYRKVATAKATTTLIHDHSWKVGNADTTLAWYAYDKFRTDTAIGDFEAEYVFQEASKATQNWFNWAVVLKNGAQTWYLRGDFYSLSTFTGSSVGTKTDWNGNVDWKSAFNGKRVRLKIAKAGTTINVFAYADSTLISTASATGCPAGAYTLYLGGESVLLDVQKVSIRSLGARQLVGTANDDGTYTSAFNTLFTDTATVSGDFDLGFRFVNQHSPSSTNFWDNWILREISGAKTMLLRSDIYALDPIGTVTFTSDWDWTNFNRIMSGAQVDMAIKRSGSAVNVSATFAAQDGKVWHYTASQTGASTTPLSFGFTNEASLVDLLQIEKTTHVGTDSTTLSVASSARTQRRLQSVRIQGKVLVIDADRDGRMTLVRADGRGARSFDYLAGHNRFPGLESGLYLTDGVRLLMP